jgi:hypothetical protein
MTYQGDFENWQSVQDNFCTDFAEPYNLIVASYDQPEYEGYAHVLWQNADGTFGFVCASHCSCYGLEDQWEPETYTPEQMRGQVERAESWVFNEHREAILAALDATPPNP